MTYFKERLIRLMKDEGGFWNFVLPALGLAGKALSGGAKGSEQSRENQNELLSRQDQTRQRALSDEEQALQDRMKLEMAQREQDQATRKGGFNDALRSQYLQGWQPAGRPRGIEMVRGGFNTIPDAARRTGADFEKQALIRMMEGEKFDSLPEMQRFSPTPLRQASAWEKVAGLLGLGLQGVGEIGKMRGGNGAGTPPFVDPEGE